MNPTPDNAAVAPEADVAAIVNADHPDPFSFLGMHEAADGALVVRAFQPRGHRLELVDAATGRPVADMARHHEEGLFAVHLPDRTQFFPYRFRLHDPDGVHDVDDPYRFGPLLGDVDRHLLAEGTHLDSYRKLGAHPATQEGVEGVSFAVWAPNARRVSVVGPFNHWDGRVHPMRFHPGSGLWEIFVPGLGQGTYYKYEIKASDGTLLALKADPYAFYARTPPETASVVWGLSDYAWSDQAWMERRGATVRTDSPMTVYEVHLGSWVRIPEEGQRSPTYRELAHRLVPYVRDMGFSHIELMPVSEFPFEGSWGYQPIGLFAPTSRYGTPDDFKYFVDACHDAGIGVIVDWVVGHFPEDPHGLVYFDGTHLYEHADPRRGRHRDWGTLIYNYGRPEVSNYLLTNALYWMDQFHIDGLRVDAVASMLYLDYSREDDDWVPNEYGGNENLEAIAFLRRMNERVYDAYPDTVTVAEESTSWPMVSQPTYLGGLGFGYKWNMGWMNDTLTYMLHDPIHRQHHHDELTFGLLYAFHENFLLPLSHDEVVHGKGSLLDRMPGDRWQKFGNLRAYFAFQWTHPGKKLIFMGDEIAQEREWKHDESIDWHLLEDPYHAGMQALVRDLNHLYRDTPALHRHDCASDGFEWIDASDNESSTISFLRKGDTPAETVAVVINFTPVVRHGYRLGVPFGGSWTIAFSSDCEAYGGAGVTTGGAVPGDQVPWHGRPHSLSLDVPPLGALVLKPDDPPAAGTTGPGGASGTATTASS